MPDFPNGGGLESGGGEAVFLAHKNGKGRHRESTRKRHMRQQSAQLFMEEVKGTEQPLQCRDMVFLLLFIFHIVGIAFLGNTYGRYAFITVGATSEESGDREDKVELYYSNFVYLAGISGLFAVAFSMMTFGLMTVIARRFVQVALGLAITISFVWGTLGTGLSPKNVVPITGFIALALSVAYAFIVWERIPFCAANLTAALSGIRANLGTLVIAASFQVVSLLYSVYFLFVVVGVYDSIQAGHLVLSHDMQICIYTLMGISYYWTYNVILVSFVNLLIYVYRKDEYRSSSLSQLAECCASYDCRGDCCMVVQTF
jgi:Plasma-membrane choline transporter